MFSLVKQAVKYSHIGGFCLFKRHKAEIGRGDYFRRRFIERQSAECEEFVIQHRVVYSGDGAYYFTVFRVKPEAAVW